jgi:hypothetical protein
MHDIDGLLDGFLAVGGLHCSMSLLSLMALSWSREKSTGTAPVAERSKRL